RIRSLSSASMRNFVSRANSRVSRMSVACVTVGNLNTSDACCDGGVRAKCLSHHLFTPLSRVCHISIGRGATLVASPMSANLSPEASAPRGRALVVEDEPHIRELVALHLKLEGLTIVEAGDGDEAVRLSEREPFDLVVLDLMLPKVDGVT